MERLRVLCHSETYKMLNSEMEIYSERKAVAFQHAFAFPFENVISELSLNDKPATKRLIQIHYRLLAFGFS